MGLDLFMLKIWGMWIKGLQNDRPSNFENDLTSGDIESGPTGSSGAGTGEQLFRETSNYDI